MTHTTIPHSRTTAPRSRTASAAKPSIEALCTAAAYLGLSLWELQAWFEHGGSADAIARLLCRRPEVVMQLLAEGSPTRPAA
jgi:hypothetical protein